MVEYVGASLLREVLQRKQILRHSVSGVASDRHQDVSTEADIAVPPSFHSNNEIQIAFDR
jgi:hypothetical protein